MEITGAMIDDKRIDTYYINVATLHAFLQRHIRMSSVTRKEGKYLRKIMRNAKKLEVKL